MRTATLPTAAGGFFSSAHDLLRAVHRAYDTGLLSRASLRHLGAVEMQPEYALGGRVKRLTIGGRLRPVAWETGNTAGYRSVLSHRLDTRETMVVLNNTSLSHRPLDDFAIRVQS